MMHSIFEKYPKVVFGIHVDDLSYSTEDPDPEAVCALLAEVHEVMQEGLEENVEMEIAHSKTIVLASNQTVADQIAQRIGASIGVTVCKKLGADYRLFGGQRGNRSDTRHVCKTDRRSGKHKGVHVKKVKIGELATRSARIVKAAKRAARAGMLKHGRGRMFVAGILPVALYGAEHEPWKEGEMLAPTGRSCGLQ